MQQALSLGAVYSCASILSTEAQVRKLLPDLRAADAAYAARRAASAGVCRGDLLRP